MKLAFGIGTVAVTNSTLSIAQWPSWDVLNQFAEHLWSLLPTGGIGGDVSIAGQVQNGRKQTLKQVTIINFSVKASKNAEMVTRQISGYAEYQS